VVAELVRGSDDVSLKPYPARSNVHTVVSRAAASWMVVQLGDPSPKQLRAWRSDRTRRNANPQVGRKRRQGKVRAKCCTDVFALRVERYRTFSLCSLDVNKVASGVCSTSSALEHGRLRSKHQGDCSAAIRSSNVGANTRPRLDRRRRWMAERVVSAHRDYRDARVDGCDESARRSVARSVMAHLHDVRALSDNFFGLRSAQFNRVMRARC
jgi:hypothetical protein